MKNVKIPDDLHQRIRLRAAQTPGLKLQDLIEILLRRAMERLTK